MNFGGPLERPYMGWEPWGVVLQCFLFDPKVHRLSDPVWGAIWTVFSTPDRHNGALAYIRGAHFENIICVTPAALFRMKIDTQRVTRRAQKTSKSKQKKSVR